MRGRFVFRLSEWGMSERVSRWEVAITADPDPTVLSRVGDTLTTFAIVPRRFLLAASDRADSLTISIDLDLPEARMDLLRRHLSRMTLTCSVQVTERE